MRLLHINPHYGETSTGSIVQSIHQYCLEQGADSYVAYSDNFIKNDRCFRFGFTFEKYLDAFAARIFGDRYGLALFSTLRLLHRIKLLKPDVLDIHCINSYNLNIYMLLRYIKKHKIPAVIVEHAEFFHTGNCSHAFECQQWKTGCTQCPRVKFATKSLLINRTHKNWVKMKNCFSSNPSITVSCVSPWLMKRALASPITRDNTIICIENGVDTNLFSPKKDEKCNNARIIGLRNNPLPIVLLVTPSGDDENKGIAYFYELAKMNPNITFVLAGPINKIIDTTNVIYLQKVNKQDMPFVYSLAKLTLLLSKAETFSMALAESLCCGTPVLGFLSGGPESICLSPFCHFVKFGDLPSLNIELQSMVIQKKDSKLISEQAIEHFSSRVMCEKYYSLFVHQHQSCGPSNK